MFCFGLFVGLALGAVLSWIVVSYCYREALSRAGWVDELGRLIVALDPDREGGSDE